MGIVYFVAPSSSGDSLYYSVESAYADNTELQKFKDPAYIRRKMENSFTISDFRIAQLNPDETVNRFIPNEDIVLDQGSYSENYQNGQRRSLSFQLINNEGKYTPSINTIWANSKFSLELGVHFVTDRITVWFKKGVYAVTKLSPAQSVEGKVINVETGDKFVLLNGRAGTIDNTVEIKYGMDIKRLIAEILGTNNKGGYPLDSTSFIYHSSFEGTNTPLTLSASAGQTWGSLLLQLADILSAELFYDCAGHLTLVPYSEVSSDNDKGAVCDFVDVKGDYASLNFDFDMESLVNHIVVVGANVNGHVCRGEALNTNASSPICVSRIGDRVGEIINDSNITTDFIAQERADYELRKSLVIDTSVPIEVPFNPFLSVNNVVTISNRFYNIKQERFMIKSISFGLGFSPNISLQVSNIQNLNFLQGKGGGNG